MTVLIVPCHETTICLLKFNNDSTRGVPQRSYPKLRDSVAQMGRRRSTLQVLREGLTNKAGYAKLKFCCNQAARCGVQLRLGRHLLHDKRASAELTEAINSINRRYRNTQICRVYLSDMYRGSVPNGNDGNDFEESVI